MLKAKLSTLELVDKSFGSGESEALMRIVFITVKLQKRERDLIEREREEEEDEEER